MTEGTGFDGLGRGVNLLVCWAECERGAVGVLGLGLRPRGRNRVRQLTILEGDLGHRPSGFGFVGYEFVEALGIGFCEPRHLSSVLAPV